MPTGFSSVTWGTGAGLFPYFLWQYPSGTPKAITGVIYSDEGATEKRLDTLSFYINGDSVGTVSRAGNGYYYLLISPDALPVTNAQLLGVGFGGAVLVQNAAGLLNNLNIVNGTLSASTSDTAYSVFASSLATNLAMAVGGDSALQTYIDGLGLSITATGTSFKFDQAINLSSDLLNITASGPITQSAPITAGMFTGSSKGSVSLGEANHIADLRAFSTGGNYAFALTDATDLTVDGLVSTETAQLTLTTTGLGDGITTSSTDGDLLREANLEGKTVKLTSAGTISGDGEIQADVLTGSSHGDAELEGIITDLGNFDTNNGNLTVGDQRTLTTLGLVSAGSGSIEFGTDTGQNIRIESHIETSGAASVVRLNSGGDITETSAGALITHKLNAYANTGITLTSLSNRISVLGTHKTNSGPNRVHT